MRHSIDWKKINGPSGTLAALLCTFGGAGLSPLAPGTVGTFAAVPLAYAIADWSGPIRALLWLCLLLLGTWAAQRFCSLLERADHQAIVIDEVVGYGIAAWTAGKDSKALFVAFLLFRAFDILKPPPVRQLDRWSKKLAERGGSRPALSLGAGVMLDDVLAGFYALGCMLLAQGWGWL
jgi:phosphatidylglycerophosphatase A